MLLEVFKFGQKATTENKGPNTSILATFDMQNTSLPLTWVKSCEDEIKAPIWKRSQFNVYLTNCMQSSTSCCHSKKEQSWIRIQMQFLFVFDVGQIKHNYTKIQNGSTKPK